MEELRRRTEAFLTGAPRPPAVGVAAGAGAGAAPFSPFLPEQARRTSEIASEFARMAREGNEEDGVQAVLDRAEELAEQGGDPTLVQQALRLFITHTPRGWMLPIPPLGRTHPASLRPGRQARRPGRLAAGEEPSEDDLDWYREDRGANEHHWHWHTVYPQGGLPSEEPGVPPKLQDRQGEIFFYMHQQMLARYDTERVAAGLQPVRPLAGIVGEELEPYEPGLAEYADRPPGTSLVNVNRPDLQFRYTWAREEADRTAVETLAQNDVVSSDSGVEVSMTPALLGHLEEGTSAPYVDESTGAAVTFGPLGSHHNIGHVLIALVRSPVLNGQAPGDPGVMWSTETAIRDPVFYRWHRHVDDVHVHWQDRQPANQFADAPSVRVRKELSPDGRSARSLDLIVVQRRAVAGGGASDFDWQAYGGQAFGGSHWDRDFSRSDDPPATDRFETMMVPADWAGPEGYLDHREFVYFVRAENLLDQPQPVTVRTFLASLLGSPGDDGATRVPADDRRQWIELDKFSYTLPPSAKEVIARPGWRSSVVMKPVSRPPKPREKASGEGAQDYCNCGWPYNLLLPRGRREGMAVRLMVVLTDGHVDMVEHDEACGSMSYCGSKDKRYPDSRSMGYPFDRPFEGGSPSQVLGALDSIAFRDMTIVWTDPVPEDLPSG